jgi:hypothetical protein
MGSVRHGVCPLTRAPCKVQLINLTGLTTSEPEKTHILLSDISAPPGRQTTLQFEWRSEPTDVYSPATAPSVDLFGRPCSVRPSKIDNETAIAAPLLYVHLYQARFLFHRIFISILSRVCTFMPVDNPVKCVYFLSELLTYSQTPWRCREETRHSLYQTRSHARGGQQ